MKLARSRLVAGALGLAVAGAATGGVIAQADDSAPRAQAAQQGGVSITPAVRRADRQARHGRHVHGQEHHEGHAAGHRHGPPVDPEPQHGRGRAQQARDADAVRARQPAVVRPAARLSGRCRLNMRRMTASGSLYGGIQVFAKQKKPKARNGIIPQWDLVGRLRLNPRSKRPNLRVGAHRRRRPRQRPLADPRRAQHRQHARSGRRHRPHHRPDARATRTIPQVSVVPGPGRLPQGRLAARHEGRQLHRHLVDHPGQQALHGEAHLQALSARDRLRPADVEALRVVDAVLAQELHRRVVADELGDRLLAEPARDAATIALTTSLVRAARGQVRG